MTDMIVQLNEMGLPVVYMLSIHLKLVHKNLNKLFIWC